MSPRLIVVVLVAALGAAPLAQDVTLKIVSPAADAYVSGPVMLQAIVDPARRAQDVERVQFFADGKLACTAPRPERPECAWDAGADVKEHIIRVVADLKDGTRAVTSTRTKGIEHAEAVRVEIVQITAVVQDRGRFVQGLGQSDFRVLEDGRPQRLTHFSSEGSPLELVIAVDVSQSMTESMPQLKNAVKKFLSALCPKDQVTLTAFNDNMFTLAKRETNAAQRLRAVDRLAPWGGTALYDVIVRGVQQLSRQPGRRVLVVFSDGDDKTSHATIETVEEAVRANDATLFMVALGRGAKDAALKSRVEQLVDLSGGRALFVERSDRLGEAFGEIVEELSNQYLLGYESGNRSRDGSWREIRIEIPGKGYSVRARQGYRAGGGS